MLAVAGVLTVSKRRSEFRALAATTTEATVPAVAVIHPTMSAGGDDLALPATLQAYVDSPIYARTTGYLQKWYVDLGGRVKQGDLLADLDTPEIDQELLQARASRDQTAASVVLAKSTAERWVNLRRSDSVSQQEVDEKQSNYDQLRATLAAGDANVRRLENLESFKHVHAPFAGIITARNVDVGTLVNAGTQQALFRLAQIDPIRVYVTVPEMDAASIRVGDPASLELSQYPGQRIDGKIVRTSGVIDPATRTLLTEINVPNHGNRLMPGGYGQVHLKPARSVARLQLPVNTLLFRAEGVRAAVVDASNHVRLRAVQIGRDFGATVEILQGISADDWIVLNPADSLDEGQAVSVERPKAAPPAAASSAGSAPPGGRGQ
ncbi:MAG: efflux RND transporter periplasmic adaptor subunit [Acidobacteriota bacterium]